MWGNRSVWKWYNERWQEVESIESHVGGREKMWETIEKRKQGWEAPDGTTYFNKHDNLRRRFSSLAAFAQPSARAATPPLRGDEGVSGGYPVVATTNETERQDNLEEKISSLAAFAQPSARAATPPLLGDGGVIGGHPVAATTNEPSSSAALLALGSNAGAMFSGIDKIHDMRERLGAARLTHRAADVQYFKLHRTAECMAASLGRLQRYSPLMPKDGGGSARARRQLRLADTQVARAELSRLRARADGSAAARNRALVVVQAAQADLTAANAHWLGGFIGSLGPAPSLEALRALQYATRAGTEAAHVDAAVALSDLDTATSAYADAEALLSVVTASIETGDDSVVRLLSEGYLAAVLCAYDDGSQRYDVWDACLDVTVLNEHLLALLTVAVCDATANYNGPLSRLTAAAVTTIEEPRMKVVDGQLEVLNDLAVTSFDSLGQPIGVDGRAMHRSDPLDDWDLRSRRYASVLESVPALGAVPEMDAISGSDDVSETTRERGRAERAGRKRWHKQQVAERALKATTVRAAAEARTAESARAKAQRADDAERATEKNAADLVQRRADGARKAEHARTEASRAKRAEQLARLTAYPPDDDGVSDEARARGRAERPARILAAKAAKAVEKAALGEARAEAHRVAMAAAHTAASKATGVDSVVGTAAREKGRAERITRRLEKQHAKEQRHVRAAARDALSASGEPVVGTMAAKSLQLLARRAAAGKPALSVRRAQNRGLRIMLDSGASRTFLTVRTGKFWDGERFEQCFVHDVQGNVISAHGGGSLSALLRDRDGVWRNEVLAKEAYESENFDADLLSLGALVDLGWDFHVIDGEASLHSPLGDVYPLEADDGHFFLPLDLGANNDAGETLSPSPPAGSAVHYGRGSNDNAPFGVAAVATLRPSAGAWSSGGGAVTAVQWPTRVHEAPVGEAATRAAEATTQLAWPVQLPPTSPLLPPEETNAMRKAEATARLEHAYGVYRELHEAWNHNTVALDLALANGLAPTAKKPPGFTCHACELGDPLGASFRRNTKSKQSLPLIPYFHVEVDIWGAVDYGDRNGYRFMLGIVCRATGKLFLQPLRAKSEALAGFKRFIALVEAQRPGIQEHLRVWIKDAEVPGVKIVSSDRGGEFTASGYSGVRSAFDEYMQSVIHRLNTPATPESGTSRIERMWRLLLKVVRRTLLTSGLSKIFFWDAFVLAGDVYCKLPTAANALGEGEAPDKTLGLAYDLRGIVRLGSCAYLRVDGAKADAVMEDVIVLGYNHDGGGYRVLKRDGTIVASIHVRPHPDITSLRVELAAARANPAAASAFMKKFFDLEGRVLDYGDASGGQLKYMNVVADAPVQPSPAVLVGDAPGHGGSRFSLNAPAPPPSPALVATRIAAANGKGVLMTNEVADALITSARAAGHVLCWLPGFAKVGQSNERFQYYREARTWAQYERMLTESFLSGITGTNRPKAVRGDLRNDVVRGILTFAVADTPVAAAHAHDDSPRAAIADAAVADDGAQDPDVDGMVPIFSLGQSTVDAIENSGATSPWTGRLRDRRLFAAAAVVPPNLSESECAFLRTALGYPAASIELSNNFVRAAAARTTGPMHLPMTWQQARSTAQWPEWLAAMRKEIGGLKREGVWEEIEREQMPEDTRAAPTQMLFNQKANGDLKCRFVVRGDLTVKGVHWIENKSTMAALEAVRMLTSFAAGSGWKIYACDWSQAFVQAPATNPNMYCELPDLPPELHDLGHSKKDKRFVAWMKRNLYGEVSGSRVWQQFLQTWMQSEAMGCVFSVNDRNVLSWDWTDAAGVTHYLKGALHVDDLLFIVSSEAIRAEFMRRLHARFTLTGGEDEATDYCGMQIRRDWVAQSVTLHQSKFAHKLMEKYDLIGKRVEPMPFKAGPHALVPWDGNPTDRDVFDYCGCVGDLMWLSRTHPDIAWRVADLAQHMQSPGPLHVEAALHVLRYLSGHLDEGLTYHGSKNVLMQPYDHRNKLILATDSTFSHAGVKATGGAAVFMNGAAIAWKIRRQTTVSLVSAEAEVKACTMGVEMILALRDLHGEFVRAEHGAIRVLVDNKAAIAQMSRGVDGAVCAAYKRAQQYCEDAFARGIVWYDYVPGTLNPADPLTKQVRNIGEFQDKYGILCGSRPSVYRGDLVDEALASLSAGGAKR